MKRAFLALLLGAAPAPTNEAIPSPFIELDTVKRIVCETVVGSGVRIDGNLVLTADRVVAGRACTIDDVPVELVHEDGARDIAIVRTAAASSIRVPLTCAGFATGFSYFAVGFAHGRKLVVQRLHGTDGIEIRDEALRGLSQLRGLVFPGMSGGPIVDEAGQVVGIVSAGNGSGLTLSRALNQTKLCRDR